MPPVVKLAGKEKNGNPQYQVGGKQGKKDGIKPNLQNLTRVWYYWRGETGVQTGQDGGGWGVKGG